MMHLPEPDIDLIAQIKAMIIGVKKCVFIANTNIIPSVALPCDCFVCRRPEGTLLTRDEDAARLFSFAPFITESLIRKPRMN